MSAYNRREFRSAPKFRNIRSVSETGRLGLQRSEHDCLPQETFLRHAFLGVATIVSYVYAHKVRLARSLQQVHFVRLKQSTKQAAAAHTSRIDSSARKQAEPRG